MKKILLIAYSFPPVGANRSKRATNLAKNLPLAGWETYVLTAGFPAVYAYDYDYSKISQKGLFIIRAASLESAFSHRRKGNKFNSLSRPPLFKDSRNFILRICSYFKDYILYPDSRILWMPAALIAGIRVARQKRIDVIMVIGEPYSSYIIGLLLKIITAKPLVIDFRDEWVGFNPFRHPRRAGLLDKMDRIAERIVIRAANLVTVTTDGIKKEFILRYPEHKRKFYCLPNGFNQDDFGASAGAKRNNRGALVISYSGSIYEGRSLRPFLQALEEIFEERPELNNDIRFIFMGTKDRIEEEYFSRPLLKKAISDQGFLPHAAALEKSLQSDLLLCLQESDPKIAYRYIPAKIYEYLASGIPVVCLGPKEGEAASLIKRTSSGVCFETDDINGIKKFLLECLNKIKNNIALNFNTNMEEINLRLPRTKVRGLSEVDTETLSSSALRPRFSSGECIKKLSYQNLTKELSSLLENLKAL